MIRALVVDDQPLVRQAVRGILSDGGVQVVGEAVNGLEAVAAVASLTPDVVVMDIRMPVLDGIEATARICGVSGSTSRVLILTTFEEDRYIVSALRAGASGFIGKGAAPEEIVDAVRTVHAGVALLSPAATRTLIERVVTGPPNAGTAAWAAEPLRMLTAREREVLLLVAAGRTNAEIASDLVISPHTAKTHVNRIMSKVGAADRAQLVILAYETGVVRAGGEGPGPALPH